MKVTGLFFTQTAAAIGLLVSTTVAFGDLTVSATHTLLKNPDLDPSNPGSIVVNLVNEGESPLHNVIIHFADPRWASYSATLNAASIPLIEPAEVVTIEMPLIEFSSPGLESPAELLVHVQATDETETQSDVVIPSTSNQ